MVNTGLLANVMNPLTMIRFAWVSLLAGVANTTAYMLQSLVVVNYPDYVAERWHVTLLIFALLIVEGLMNMYTFWLIPWIELMAGILHIVLFIIFVVVLVTLAPRHNADFVFFEKSQASGWDNYYVSWNLGLLTPTWGFVGTVSSHNKGSLSTDSSRFRWCGTYE
jgi:choline transport protein